MAADYNWVTNRVATGGAIFKEAELEELKEAGVTHIINCQSEWDDAEKLPLEKYGMEYLWAGIDDDAKSKDVEWFDRIIDFALYALAAPRNKIFVHCMAGYNRGPSAAYAILRAQGLNRYCAQKLIVEVRDVGLQYIDDADRAITELGYE